MLGESPRRRRVMKHGPPTPIAVPPGAPVLLYGGVFDPPHRAHVDLPTLARDRCMPGAWLVYIPAARSPFKGSARASDAQRTEMLRLAIRDIPRAIVWTDEIDRAEPGEASYWIDTVRRARGMLGTATPLRFLIGADQAAEFHRWRAFREILMEAEPLVMLRPPIGDVGAFIDALHKPGVWSEVEIAEWTTRVGDLPIFDASATDARARMTRGEPPTDLLDPRILAYIREHGLYGGPQS
jgi:nicotinate-nucleotide adenylyltransferase